MKRKLLVILMAGCLTAGSCMTLGGCGAAEVTKAGDVVAESELDEERIAMEIAESEALEALLNTENSEETELVEEETVDEHIKQITITATGDCTLGKTQEQGYDASFESYYDARGEKYFFNGVRDVFEADDFTLINLECVLSTSTDRVDKTYNLKGDPTYVGIMTSSSVEACTLGNNHSSDYGPQSLTDTQNALDAADIEYGYNDHLAVYTTGEGIKVGLVSASVLNMSETNIGYLKDGIMQLRSQGVDVVIAACHWGAEGEHYPMKSQIDLAHELVDCGADLVIGNHPHVLQGVELYNGKIICYSLGNFCFGANRNPTDKNTMMFQQTFTFVDGQLQADVNAQIIPCLISSVSGYNDFQPTIVTEGKKQLIIEDVNTYSAQLSNICFDAEGKLMLKE